MLRWARAGGAPWVALIDDDCEPAAHWLMELVLAAHPGEHHIAALVAGLVLPAHLDSANDIIAEIRDADEKNNSRRPARSRKRDEEFLATGIAWGRAC